MVVTVVTKVTAMTVEAVDSQLSSNIGDGSDYSYNSDSNNSWDSR